MELESQKELKLLIVEDDEIILKILVDILKDEFTELLTAQDGEKGLKLYKRERVDIVVTDMKMPKLNGKEMIESIRSIEPTQIIIAISSHLDSQSLLEFIKLSVDSFIPKPLDRKSILDSIEKAKEIALARKAYREYNSKLEDIVLKRTAKLSEINRTLREYKRAIDISTIVSKTDIAGVITYVNDRFIDISGYCRDELIGKNHNITRDESIPKKLFKEMWETILGKKIWRGILKNRAKNGEPYYVDTTIVPILNDRDEILEFIAIRNSVTELIQKRKALVKSLYTDSLTKFPNRAKLLSDIERVKDPTLFLLNIDSFGELNDLYGEEVGDFILTDIANRLERKLKKSEKIYKMPVDEFAILLNSHLSDSEAVKFGEYLIKIIEQESFKYDDMDILVRASVGISKRDSKSFEPIDLKKLVLHADMALRKAKILKKDTLIYRDDSNIKLEYKKNIDMASTLKDAITNSRIVPFYQAILNNRTEKIEKYEALVRLIKQDREIISPFFFLDIAKKSRLYESITKIMIDRSFEYFKDREDLEFSINVSIEDIANPNIREFILNRIKNSKVSKQVVFEILESDGFDDYNIVAKFIEEVKKYDSKVAIDDFGSGYSNFKHILELEIDFLKIDASIIKNIDKDDNSKIITDTIVNFANKLNIKTIAEFVSSESIFNEVKKRGVDFSQGFFISKPNDRVLNSI